MSRLAKLIAMATQDDSPTERDVAVAKLKAMGKWPPPPSKAERLARQIDDLGPFTVDVKHSGSPYQPATIRVVRSPFGD